MMLCVLPAVATDDIMQDLKELAAELLSPDSDSNADDENTWRQLTDYWNWSNTDILHFTCSCWPSDSATMLSTMAIM